MPFPSRLKEQIQSIVAGIKTVLLDFLSRVEEIAAQIGVKIRVILDGLSEKIPSEKQRLVKMIAVGAGVVLLAIVGTSFLTKNRSGEQGISPAGNATPSYTSSAGREPIRRVVIPPDELFLPSEPDFVPGVMLGRDRRAVWTAEDAAPLWQDPLKSGEQEWRDRIEKTVDEILESVP